MTEFPLIPRLHDTLSKARSACTSLRRYGTGLGWSWAARRARGRPARCVFARRRGRGRPGRTLGPTYPGRERRPVRRRWLGRAVHARRLCPHQQSCDLRRHGYPRHLGRWARLRRVGGGRRSRDGLSGAAPRCAGARLRAARQFAPAARGSAGDRDRQSAGLPVHRHRRRRKRPRAVAARTLGPADRQRHPDRRRAQSRQLRRSAGQFHGRGRRHQYGDHRGRAGHLLLDLFEHSGVRGRAAHPRRACAPLLHRGRGAKRGAAAPAIPLSRARAEFGRAGAIGQCRRSRGQGRRVGWRHNHRRRRNRDPRHR